MPSHLSYDCASECGLILAQCPPESTVGVFGDKLRKQRELRGISLDAISTTTKISPRMLRAIEDEHFDQLPGGVFNKGFVRAYARQVGLDEEEAVSDYLAALRESQIQSQNILPKFHNPSDHPASETETAEPTRRHLEAPAADSPADRRMKADDRRKDARRNQDRQARSEEAPPEEARPESHPHHASFHEHRPDRTPDDAVPSRLSSLNFTSATPSSQQSHPEPIAGPAPPTADIHSHRVPWEKLAAALLLITFTLALWTLHRHKAPAAATPATASLANPAPAASTPAAPVPIPASTKPSAITSPPTAKRLAPAPAPAAPQAVIASDTDLNPPVPKPQTRGTAVKPPLTFTLLIRADQTSWVSITADGQPRAQETLIAPANTSVRASHEIIVKVGNSAGISFLLNGKEIPSQGTPGEVRTFTFDASGIRASAVSLSPNTTP
jgi:hypothetical protein